MASMSPTDAPGHRARQRLRYEEALVLQTLLAQRRAQTGAAAHRDRPHPAARVGCSTPSTRGCRSSSRRASKRSGRPWPAEMSGDAPMNRLLQGEVGSGKTVIALRAMLAAVDAGGQAALLAPTEVLAAQHHRSITSMLGDLAEGGMLGGSEIGTQVALLTGSQSTAARKRSLLDVGQRRRRHRHRHACPDPGAGPVLRPRARGRRRAAPVRRRAARCAAGEGETATARARHDRHADPADRDHDGVRRHGDLDADRAAARSVADHDPRRAHRQPPLGRSAPGSASPRRSAPAGRRMSCARGSCDTERLPWWHLGRRGA